MKKIILTLSLILLTTGCTRPGDFIANKFKKTQPAQEQKQLVDEVRPTEEVKPETNIGLANPASVNCKEKGGTLEIKKRGDGGEYGLCNFEDNRACEEWALMRGECIAGGLKTTGYDNDAQKYCVWIGGMTIAKAKAVCTFSDQSTCPVDELFNGQCAAGQNPKKVLTEGLKPELTEGDLDARILLTTKNYKQYTPKPDENASDMSFDYSEANILTKYENSRKGLAFSVPYNVAWGTDVYRVEPIDEYVDFLSFGKLGFVEYGFSRDYEMHFKPAQTAAKAIVEIRKKPLLDAEPETIKINDLTVVKYTDGGLCTYPTLLVIGIKYNYEFSPSCGTGDANEFKALEDIVKTVKLIK